MEEKGKNVEIGKEKKEKKEEEEEKRSMTMNVILVA